MMLSLTMNVTIIIRSSYMRLVGRAISERFDLNLLSSTDW